MPHSSNVSLLRNSLRPVTAEHQQVADLLSSAADAFLAGEIESARGYLRAADLPSLFRFGRLLMDRKDPEVAWPKRQQKGPIAAMAKIKVRMPSDAEKLVLYSRDGWRCRYCGCRVIYARSRDILRRAFPLEIPWPKSGPMHGGFFALTATADHIVPHASGGDNSAANLVTACWPCNFAMEHDSLEELGLSDPRLRPPVSDGWDGLTRLITKRASTTSPQVKPQSAGDANDATKKKPRTVSTKPFHDTSWFDRLNANERLLAQSLVAFLDGCRDLGVTWSADEVLVARMSVGEHRVQFFGVESGLATQVPWSTNTPKAHLRRFAVLLAEMVPGATVRETPKLWNVGVPPLTTVPLNLLLEDKQAIRFALETLHSVLQTASG